MYDAKLIRSVDDTSATVAVFQFDEHFDALLPVPIDEAGASGKWCDSWCAVSQLVQWQLASRECASMLFVVWGTRMQLVLATTATVATGRCTARVELRWRCSSLAPTSTCACARHV
jgi:hypothetical protein